MERHEMKSVLRALAKFHADGMKFLRENDNLTKYSFIEVRQGKNAKPQHRFMVCLERVNLSSLLLSSIMSFQKNPKRYEFVTDLLDKYLEPYLNYLDQFTPIKPAVLLLREMSK